MKLNTLKGIKETKFEELFDSKKEAVISFLSLEDRHYDLVQRYREVMELPEVKRIYNGEVKI